MSNSTEPARYFAIKKWIGFSFGIISAMAASCSAYALIKIVYPKRNNNDEDDGVENRSASSIFIIVLKLFMATSISVRTSNLILILRPEGQNVALCLWLRGVTNGCFIDLDHYIVFFFSFHPTAPRPPLLQQDVFYSLNQSLTFLDEHNAIACEARGIWFQIGFQSSFFFTACTAYELYNMITTTMKDSSFAVRNLHGSHSGRGSTNCWRSLTRFQQYVIVNLILVSLAVLVILSDNGFGSTSRTIQHTLCWVYTNQWSTLVATLPSFFCWVFNCVFIGLSAYRLWLLSKYSSGNGNGQTALSSEADAEDKTNISNIRSGFIPVIRKMLLFPTVTFIVWIIPMVECFILAFATTRRRHENMIVETITQVAINLQGTTNCIILMLTNSLVRQEIMNCCCSRCNRCRREEGQYDGADIDDDNYYQQHYNDGYDEDENESGNDEFRIRQNNGQGQGHHYQHQYGKSLDEPLFVSRMEDRRTEPAYSEDVSIMRFTNQRIGSDEEGGDGRREREEGGRNLTTPDVPSLGGSF